MLDERIAVAVAVIEHGVVMIGLGDRQEDVDAVLLGGHTEAVRERVVGLVIGSEQELALRAATRWRAASTGLDPLAPAGVECAGVREWLVASTPDVVFEAVPLDPHAGQPASTPDEAAAAFKALGQPKAVVKAQIHAGGRGKAGGVKLLSSAEEAREFAAKLLGKTLVTHQTGPQGRVVRRVYVHHVRPWVPAFAGTNG